MHPGTWKSCTTTSSLSETPEGGAYPKELLAVGIRKYREIFFKPYRIIYRVLAENVYLNLPLNKFRGFCP